MNKTMDCPQCGGVLIEGAWENLQETEVGGVVIDAYSAYVCQNKCGFVKRIEDFPRVIAQQSTDCLLLLFPNDQARILDVRDSLATNACRINLINIILKYQRFIRLKLNVSLNLLIF